MDKKRAESIGTALGLVMLGCLTVIFIAITFAVVRGVVR